MARTTHLAFRREADDMVAGLEVGYSGACIEYDASAFMAQNNRQVSADGTVAFPNSKICVAQTGGLDLYQHFTRAGRIERDFIDHHGLVQLKDNGGIRFDRHVIPAKCMISRVLIIVRIRNNMRGRV